VSVIPNGIDLKAYRPETEKLAKRVVFVGRDEPRKGLSVLMAAWPRVLAAHSEATLVVLGAGGQEVGATVPSIEYRGRVSEQEKRDVLGEASVLVAPNLGGESFGLVLIEGMASRCAVVASDIPAFRAVAGTAASLVQPGSPLELADAVIALLADPARIEAMGQSGLERVRQFDWSQVLPQYRACYQEAVGTFNRQG
jgi:phosphatidylinositol alpha-mannosyltransferase